MCSRGMWYLVVTCWSQILLQQFVSKGSSLWKSINCLANLKTHLTFVDVFGEVVLIDGVLWEIFDGDFHVFIPIEGSA